MPLNTPEGFLKRLPADLPVALVRWQSLAVLCVGLLLTWGQVTLIERWLADKAQNELTLQASEVAAGIKRRLTSNIEVLRGVSGLFAAGQPVSRVAFRNYVEALRIAQDQPGIQGIGYAEWIGGQGREEVIERIRKEGFPDFQILPAGEREDLTAILQLEPFDWRNQRAFGYDMYSEPVRRAAMARARDEGRAAISDRVTLVQETFTDVQPGFLIYLPIYRTGALLASAEQRRAALIGWAYSPLRAADLFQEFLRIEHPDLGSRYRMRLYAGSQPRQEDLLFDSHPDVRIADSAIETVHVDGTLWTMELASLPNQVKQQAWVERSSTVWGIGIAGTLVMAALAGLLGLNHQRLGVTLAAARREHGAVLHQQDLLQAIHDSLSVGIVLLDAEGRIQMANHRMADMMRLPMDRLIQSHYLDLLAPGQDDDAGKRLRLVTSGDGLPPAVERCYRRADGTTFWGEVNGRPLKPPHPATAGTTRGVVLAIEDVTRRREDQARIQHLAHHDHLTGLPNRPYFIERAQQAIDLARRQGRKVGLLFIDLDCFKQVNDSFGHDAGDCVLKTVANRMRTTIRTSDTVCRQGGDEYVVLLPDLESVQGLQTLAHKLLAAIEEPIAYDQQALSVSASIGMAYFPDHATTIEALVAAADAAMYQAKGDETRRVSLYEPV